jgi:hypothetical protein
MADKHAVARYRRWYQKLLRCYPRPHRERFGESMEQTFHDLCCERSNAGKGLFGFALWMFVETSAGIIRENGRFIMMQNKNVILIALATVCVLLLPLFAKWPWGLFDFLIGGALLFGTGLTFDLVARKGGTIAYRAAIGITCATGLLLVWMNLAVGLIGNEDNPANLMYIGVLAVGVIGASVARLEPSGMALTLFSTAIAQALVPVIALIVLRPSITSGVVQVLGVNALFVALWAGAALLFRHAGVPSSSIRGKDGGGGANRGGAIG